MSSTTTIVRTGRCILLALLFFSPAAVFSQASTGVLWGRVVDASTNCPVTGAAIVADSSTAAANRAITRVDGVYQLRLSSGRHHIRYSLNGFQSVLVMDILIRPGGIVQKDILLDPLAQGGRVSADSVLSGDSVRRVSSRMEYRLRRYHPVRLSPGVADIVAGTQMDAGMDGNATGIAKRLSGAVFTSGNTDDPLRSLNISGLGPRYNQVLLNGVVWNPLDPLTRAYPLDLLPAEAVESITIRRAGDGSVPADFAGGTVAINLKDYPERNFFYIKAGGGLTGEGNDRHFFGDRRNDWQPVGFPGNQRDLPAGFPNGRSRTNYNQQNPQLKLELARTLRNNLTPVDYGKMSPDEQALIGFGRVFRLKKDTRIGLIGFIGQSRTERIEDRTEQILPFVATNPYPFSDGSKQLIGAQATDRVYRYASRLSATLNASLVYKHSKISLRTFAGNQLINEYANRSAVNKPDEDTLAHSGIFYGSVERTFINTVLGGEHALGKDTKFILSWKAGYNFYRIRQPDERSFLLRQDSTDPTKYEIAHPSAPAFHPVQTNPNQYDPNLTNSGRQWREERDNDFEGSVSLRAPFNFFGHAQLISGGIDIKSRNREFFSDVYPTSGLGYYTLDGLLAPERYYPGGLTVSSYYTNFAGSYNAIYANYRGNYQASANLGSAWLRFDVRLFKGLSASVTGRLESSSRLVSNTEYDYVEGYRNARRDALDKNIFVDQVDFLPTARLSYRLLKSLDVFADYSATVNRPELQELTAYRYFDPNTFMVTIGNPILQPTRIDNADAGASWIPVSGFRLSVTGYYKRIDQPIEYIVTPYTAASVIAQPNNLPPATIWGGNLTLDLDLGHVSRADWATGFSLFGSVDLLKSTVKAGPVRYGSPVPEHKLTGSPDHTVNAGFRYQRASLPGITVLYVRTGDYLTALGSGTPYKLANGNIVNSIPDYRVKGRDQLDIRISQQFFHERLQVTAGVDNLLNDRFIQYQDLNGNKKFDAPLVLKTVNGKEGFYQGGTDSAPVYRKFQRTWFATISYSFH